MKRLALGIVSVLAVAAVVAAGAVWRFGDRNVLSESQTIALDAPDARDTEDQDTPAIAPENFGGPFSLTDQFGKRRSDAEFRGKFMLIFFGYTFCPDVCPTALAVEAEALDRLGPSADRIVPIFITIDPRRDTQAQLKSYLSAFDAKPPAKRPNIVGLTGSDEEIASVAKAYSVYYKAHIDGLHGGDQDYSIDHSTETYLMSPEGKFVAYYALGISPDEMAADLKLKTGQRG